MVDRELSYDDLDRTFIETDFSGMVLDQKFINDIKDKDMPRYGYIE